MQAFPKGSLNNALGGAGPLNKEPDHAVFMGTANEEAFTDFATGGAVRHRNGFNHPRAQPIFDPARQETVHGDESYGLGTSTFLEGTPAAKTAIQKHEAEQAQVATDVGLQRKKSLAQRIRNINRGPRDMSAGGRVTSPDGAYYVRSPDLDVPSAASDNSPFFAEYGKGEEDVLSVRPRDGGSSSHRPPAPRPRRPSHNQLERRATTDATASADEPAAKPSGILGRMKSLKGSRKPRGPDGSGNPPANPGTAV